MAALNLLCALGVIIHRLTQICTDWMVETADFADSAEKICANLCNLRFLSTDGHRFTPIEGKTTEDTEIYREHRKNFFFAPSASLLSPRLRFTLGVLCALGGLGVPIHRLTQIYTD